MSDSLRASQPLALPRLWHGLRYRLTDAHLLLWVLFAGAWLWHLGDVALSPPTDNIEQLTWMRSLEWGYYKHPPLPTWLMWLATRFTGWSAQTSYGLGALCTLASVALATSVIKDSVGPRFAWVCALATLCITFYNGRLNYYNHNTLLTLWVALSAWLWWRLLTQPHLKWWLWLGVVSGLAVLTKYQYVIVAVSSLWLIVRFGLWRSAPHRRGMLMCTAITVLMVLPHLLWLRAQPLYSPIGYAMHSSLGVQLAWMPRLEQAGLWLADWLFNRSVLAMVLIASVGWGVRRSRAKAGAPPPARAVVSDQGWHLLMAWGCVPPVFMVVLSLTTGAELQLHWGTAFALWTPPLVMLALRVTENGLNSATLRRATLLFVVLQGMLLGLSYQTSAFGRHPSTPSHWRQFPADALTQSVAESARLQLGGPIEVISGPAAASGAVALRLPEQPKVLIDGNPDISPWITRHELAGRRILELWAPGTGPEGATPAINGWRWTTLNHEPELWQVGEAPCTKRPQCVMVTPRGPGA